MRKRLVPMLLAGTMLLSSVLAGCSSEPKNPGDSGNNTDAAASTTAAEAGASTEAAAPSETPASGGTFRNYLTTDIDTINPHIYTASASSDVFRMTTLMLYRDFPTEDGKAFELVPELAAEEPIKMDEEGKKWEIKIREGLTWENGDHINVDDVI